MNNNTFLFVLLTFILTLKLKFESFKKRLKSHLFLRIWETYGEDVALGQKMGEAFVKGQQGNDLKDKTKTASCLKHYIGYGLPYNGRDRSPAYIPAYN